MSRGISPQSIEKATGRSWDEWLALFDSIGASSLTHKEITTKLIEMGITIPWWTQMATVAYEQHIGRRVPGQLCDGKFAVSVNKTLNGTMDDAITLWAAAAAKPDATAGVEIVRGPEVTQTEKWRYWRAALADGTRLNVNVYEKSPGKAALSVQHEKLESEDLVELWRAHWKSVVAEL
jgi:hypothetical protein